MPKSWTTAAALACAVAGAAACGQEEPQVETAEMKGAQIYRNVCATCHAADPNEDGVLGPAIADASEELLYARVVKGEYPPGYTPKRPTSQMVALPHIEPYVPQLAAYLASAKR